MCDTLIIERALLSQSSEGRTFMKDLQYRLGQVPGKKDLTSAEKRARCRSCVIYEFHQRQKYKLISPLVFPAVIITAWFFYSKIASLITSVLGVTEKFVHKISFLPQSTDQAVPNAVVPEVVLGLFVIWLTIVAISYTLQFIEFCIFKLGI
jgi:energy-coupling factor transporter transmembrane protein EcfT